MLKVLHQLCIRKASGGKYHGNTKVLARYFKTDIAEIVSLLRELESKKQVKLYFFESEYFIVEIIPNPDGLKFDIRLSIFGLTPGML
jgi:hypothetical protein